jgi:hypothetical protein
MILMQMTDDFYADDWMTIVADDFYAAFLSTAAGGFCGIFGILSKMCCSCFCLIVVMNDS